MKNNLLVVLFLFLCLLSTGLTLGLVIWYHSSFHKFRDIQLRYAQASTAQTILKQMVADTAEYNKTARNPDITHLLQPYMAVRPAGTAAPAAKPVTK